MRADDGPPDRRAADHRAADHRAADHRAADTSAPDDRAADASAADGGANGPEAAIADVGGIPISALIQEAERPRAVIVALHGGSTTSAYFDAPGRPRWSLLRTGAALGFTVIALDRPGYGASAPYAHRMAPARRRVELAYGAVDRLLAARPRGAGVFLMAHSVGCALAVQMATAKRGRELLGLELAGIGLRPHPRVALAMEATSRDRPGIHDLVWGPEHLYPTGMARQPGVTSPAPSHDGVDARGWVRAFPGVAEQVRVPVRYSLGEHEAVWRSGSAALAEVAALFTASPRVTTHEQADGGHNLSLGRSAPAYHLTVLSFAEECVLDREVALTAGPLGAARTSPSPSSTEGGKTHVQSIH